MLTILVRTEYVLQISEIKYINNAKIFEIIS